MAHLFCSECGSKNIYTLSKPKFCQSCGNSFVMASHVKKAKASFSNSHEQAEESLPDITKLQYEINIVDAMKDPRYKDVMEKYGKYLYIKPSVK